MMPPPSRVSPVSYAPSKGAAMGSFATVQERVMVAVPRRIAQRGSLALMSWTASSQAELTRRLSYSALDATKHFPRVLLGGSRSSPGCQRPKSRLKDRALVVSDQGPDGPLAVADICHRQNVTVGSGRLHPPAVALRS